MTDTPEPQGTGSHARATRRRVLQATAGALAVGVVSGRGAAQASGTTVYVGSSDDNLYAVDAGTGSEEWAFETGDQVDSSPTVVTDPQNGDSVGSRVMLGTLGHHGNWRYAGQNNESESDGFGPGFGVGGALAGVGGAGYLLKRRFDDENSE